MRHLNNQNGIALVTSLMFTVLSLVITMTLLYMVTSGIRTSSAMKRYRSVTQAVYGGTDIMLKDILAKGLMDGKLTDATFKSNMLTYLGSLSSPLISDCLRIKIMNPTGKWTGACADTSLDATKAYDVKFNLNSASNMPFTVYSKIVDTMDHRVVVFANTSTATGMQMQKKVLSIPGNSDPSNVELEGFAVVEKEGSAGDTNPHIPYVYRVEVQAERSQNATEKAKISVQYAF